MFQSQIIAVLLFLPLIACQVQGQTSTKSDLSQITELIGNYAVSGDKQDAAALEGMTHTDFRIVFRISDEQTITLPKSVYLDKIKTKEFGGDKRSVEIQSVDLKAGKTAFANVVLRSEKATMSNFLTFVKEGGTWKLVADTAFMEE
ncbi:MAG: nuclear transport factor 2 family protein [Bacteroidia bacterium]|nr:nuclear transport factor 2 family protein [Bacteroidia bacterium]